VSSEGQRYDDDEVEAILRRALERQMELGEKLEHEQLVEAAREVGLDDDAVARAIGEIQAERNVTEIRARLRRDRRESWTRHFGIFAIVAGGLVLLNTLGLAGGWALVIAIVWAMFVALHAIRGFRQTTDREVEREQYRLNRAARRRADALARHERARRKAEERARRAEERARRSERRRSRGNGPELERVIEDGVSLLMGAIAKNLREAAQQREPQTDFERFVARKKGQAHGEEERQPRAEGPKVRVAPVEDEPEEEERGSSRSERRSRKR
jgi:hypothetical protein